jgi:hypothetical protein
MLLVSIGSIIRRGGQRFFRCGDRMFGHLSRVVVKVLLASLIVGTILAHFGITAHELMRATGFSTEHLEEMARQGVAWALPNVLLGSVVIVPVWFLAYLFRPPGESRD